MLTVTGFAAMGLRFGLSPVLPAYCYLAVLSVTLGFIDARHRRLPDVLTLSAYPAGAALLGAAAVCVPGGPRLLAHAMLGAALAGGLYLVLACLYPPGIGWGDVKLSGVLGMFLGWLGARAFAAGLVSPFVLTAASRRGADRGRSRHQEQPHPVRPVHGQLRPPPSSWPVLSWPRDDRAAPPGRRLTAVRRLPGT